MKTLDEVPRKNVVGGQAHGRRSAATNILFGFPDHQPIAPLRHAASDTFPRFVAAHSPVNRNHSLATRSSSHAFLSAIHRRISHARCSPVKWGTRRAQSAVDGPFGKYFNSI